MRWPIRDAGVRQRRSPLGWWPVLWRWSSPTARGCGGRDSDIGSPGPRRATRASCLHGWFGCDPAEDSGLHPAEETAKLVVDIVAHRIPAKFGLDPVRDIQVLAPMHRGPAGAGNLNTLLQDALIPERDGTPEKRYGGRVFRVGDKVTQLRNNYQKGAAGIFNGTIAVVTSLSLQQQTVTVLTDEDEQIDYDFAELDELAHAYAVTIHRSQGSEYPAVVIPLTTSSWMMLQRNLLYTGITRAKQLIVLVGSRRALAQAVRTPGAGRRHPALTYRLSAPTQARRLHVNDA